MDRPLPVTQVQGKIPASIARTVIVHDTADQCRFFWLMIKTPWKDGERASTIAAEEKAWKKLAHDLPVSYLQGAYMYAMDKAFLLERDWSISSAAEQLARQGWRCPRKDRQRVLAVVNERLKLLDEPPAPGQQPGSVVSEQKEATVAEQIQAAVAAALAESRQSSRSPSRRSHSSSRRSRSRKKRKRKRSTRDEDSDSDVSSSSDSGNDTTASDRDKKRQKQLADELCIKLSVVARIWNGGMCLPTEVGGDAPDMTDKKFVVMSPEAPKKVTNNYLDFSYRIERIHRIRKEAGCLGHDADLEYLRWIRDIVWPVLTPLGVSLVDYHVRDTAAKTKTPWWPITISMLSKIPFISCAHARKSISFCKRCGDWQHTADNCRWKEKLAPHHSGGSGGPAGDQVVSFTHSRKRPDKASGSASGGAHSTSLAQANPNVCRDFNSKTGCTRSKKRKPLCYFAHICWAPGSSCGRGKHLPSCPVIQ